MALRGMENKNRIGYIDMMKGIAIVCVLLGHYFSFPFLSILIWSFHMPLFVFLNGFFFKDGPIVNRIRKSWLSYMKPYIIVWLFLIVIESLISYYKGENANMIAKERFISGFWALASNRALFRPEGVVKIGVIWFLNALFIGSVLQAITLKIQNVFGQFFFIVLSFLGAIIQTATICVPFGLNYGVAFLSWLWLGYQYKKIEQSKVVGYIESQKGFVFFLIIWIGIVSLEYLTGKGYNICWLRLPLYGVELLGAFSGIIVVMHISKYIENHLFYLASIFRYLGICSLWILCIHAVDVEILRNFTAFPIEANSIRFVIDITIALSIRELYKSTLISKLRKI